MSDGQTQGLAATSSGNVYDAGGSYGTWTWRTSNQRSSGGATLFGNLYSLAGIVEDNVALQTEKAALHQENEVLRKTLQATLPKWGDSAAKAPTNVPPAAAENAALRSRLEAVRYERGVFFEVLELCEDLQNTSHTDGASTEKLRCLPFKLRQALLGILELGDNLQRLRDSETELLQECQRLREEAELRGETERNQDARAQLEQECERLRAEVNELQGENRQLRGVAELLDEERRLRKEEVAELHANNRQLRDAKSELERQCHGLQEEVTRLQGECQKFREAEMTADLERCRLQDQATMLKDELRKLRDLESDAEKERLRLQEGVVALQDENQRLRDSEASLEQRCRQLQQDVAGARAESEDSKESAQSAEMLRNEVVLQSDGEAALEQERRRHREKLGYLRGENESLRECSKVAQEAEAEQQRVATNLERECQMLRKEAAHLRCENEKLKVGRDGGIVDGGELAGVPDNADLDQVEMVGLKAGLRGEMRSAEEGSAPIVGEAQCLESPGSKHLREEVDVLRREIGMHRDVNASLSAEVQTLLEHSNQGDVAKECEAMRKEVSRLRDQGHALQEKNTALTVALRVATTLKAEALQEQKRLEDEISSTGGAKVSSALVQTDPVASPEESCGSKAHQARPTDFAAATSSTAVPGSSSPSRALGDPLLDRALEISTAMLQGSHELLRGCPEGQRHNLVASLLKGVDAPASEIAEIGRTPAVSRSGAVQVQSTPSASSGALRHSVSAISERTPTRAPWEPQWVPKTVPEQAAAPASPGSPSSPNVRTKTRSGFKSSTGFQGADDQYRSIAKTMLTDLVSASGPRSLCFAPSPTRSPASPPWAPSAAAPLSLVSNGGASTRSVPSCVQRPGFQAAGSTGTLREEPSVTHASYASMAASRKSAPSLVQTAALSTAGSMGDPRVVGGIPPEVALAAPVADRLGAHHDGRSNHGTRHEGMEPTLAQEAAVHGMLKNLANAMSIEISWPQPSVSDSLPQSSGPRRHRRSKAKR